MNRDLQKKANSLALTQQYAGVTNILMSKIQIISPDRMEIICRDAEGIWDTGATVSVISRQLAETLGLKPVSFGFSNTANGRMPNNIYYLGLGLPNGVAIPNLRICDGNIPCDLLIGMDVISCGDFHISNVNGKTVFTFRIPSLDEKDYVKEIELARACATKATLPKKKKK